ncbi:MAG TPA: DUF1028 domain-containing protein [Deinococcales bacterium]|nr:DUF1028 domain-containing protein [Deinococcales bacterium]
MKTVDPLIATFSIVARDPETGDLAVATASKFLAVGAYVPTARAGVGAIASQSHVNTTYGERTLKLLQEGKSPEDIAREFEATDDEYGLRQFGIVSADGSSFTHTGPGCHAWAGGVNGPDFAAQGNILTGPDVVDALVDTMNNSDLPFPERLVAALQAAEDKGGDRRGRQSAALLVVGENKGYGGLTDRWIDLRVDDHPDPIPELKRILELHRLFLDNPADEPRDLSGADIAWLQQVLEREGYLEAAAAEAGTWNDATEQALKGLYGVENLEQRWVDGPRIDPVAWTRLQNVFGGD